MITEISCAADLAADKMMVNGLYDEQKRTRCCSNFPSYFICKLIIRQFERSAHPWNVFQHSKRNFVSLHGHVISSIYSSSKYRTEAQSDLKISGSNSGLISWNSRNKPKSHELTRPILSRYWYIISRQITVAQSANPSTLIESPLFWRVAQVSRLKPRASQNSNSLSLE